MEKTTENETTFFHITSNDISKTKNIFPRNIQHGVKIPLYTKGEKYKENTKKRNKKEPLYVRRVRGTQPIPIGKRTHTRRYSLPKDETAQTFYGSERFRNRVFLCLFFQGKSRGG